MPGQLEDAEHAHESHDSEDGESSAGAAPVARLDEADEVRSDGDDVDDVHRVAEIKPFVGAGEEADDELEAEPNDAACLNDEEVMRRQSQRRRFGLRRR